QINLSLELPEGLEQCLIYLETVSEKGRNFIIKEALIKYIEDMEDIQKLSLWEEIKRLVRMYSFVDDVILDPFAGNGTTLKVARELGRNW
ncbi:13953_t:CDS:2, partial [Racocetra fulgida]